MLGFLLTVVLGKVYSDWQDSKQRERDAAAKSMNDLRASVDDMVETFQAYFVRAATYVNAVDSDAPLPVVTAAAADFQAAYYKWAERFAIDRINIEQRYPSRIYGTSAVTASSSIETDILDLHRCILVGRQGPPSQIAREQGATHEIVCDTPNTKIPVAVSVRLVRMNVCVGLYSIFLRPDPAYDYTAPDIKIQASHNSFVESNCAPAYVDGVGDKPMPVASAQPAAMDHR
ncbi:hypothetical protein R69658_01648 [Paraburkholderia aspalathi]|uniref:Uncharacterized protein n=1 Tax=Paraburkholderia aspalathi TaxID=1324617 RepID=A0ABN7L2E6_9BURK|nr:hypothetical protein [Paraburkholderia aspalathi]MBK3818341.1 hypothetical protein [Paraburkholderia aspalathi]MBK3830195.1 hypothetical protein [Paraburkholderia aspalathi]MBK3859367.1 hypothetical protein [Paraburkholderia aspalathi]CAE6727357.1 hypothetical protein R69658_01648 [Paraburkholderia aspalathi]